MAKFGGVSADTVAKLYPLAPIVSDDDVQGASDWAELEAGGEAPPVSGTPRYRELQRAVAAYALYLATGGNAASQYGNAVSHASSVKSFTIGPIKIDRATTDTEKIGESLTTSAVEWLEIAGRHLAAAGFSGGWGFPGAAR